MSQNNVLFFYKGSCTPSVITGENEEEAVMKFAKDMIVQGLRFGESLEQQKADYVQQLDVMEQALFDAQKAGWMNYKMFKKACKSVNKMEDTFHSLWSLNICALLILKVIKNDDRNGVLRISGGVGFEDLFESNKKPACDDKALKSKLIDIDLPTFNDTKINKKKHKK